MADKMGLITSAARPVTLQRNGNSRVLPVPAELVRAADIDFGDAFTVQVVGDDIVFHRAHGNVALLGSGANRVGVIDDANVFGAPQYSTVPPLDGWDY